ncbi:MAG: efflux RND transporter permease subunit, partial [Pirellulales bacterium]|nr:efflux RND transporter permease subunit [Pirellulales bacterium]
MLNHIIAFCLRNRLLVLAVTAVLVVYGGRQSAELPIDVFPNLNRPTVTIMTEAHGLAPEEVETLVTFPIESAMNGASDVRRVRSASGIGLSIVWVEFDWGTDIYVDRQIVAEKLQLVRERLPEEANAVMAPITSIMGEIMLVGMRSTGKTTPMELRTIADWEVRQRLLAVTGVSQVSVMGGEMKQYQVLTSPERLSRHDVTLDQLIAAVEKSNIVTGGGFLLSKNHESLIRIVGRATTLDEVADTVVRAGNPVPITIREVAEVRHAGPVRRGDASIEAQRAVILSVQKQPGADTLVLTERIEDTLHQIQKRLPADVVIVTDIFKQADFIEAAIDNVREAIRDGVLWVIVVLFVFLANVRTSLITLTAIPLSIIMTALVFAYFGISINTMTLGGLAVAIGELVDDSIVDIENIYRRLKENYHSERPQNPIKVIFLASCEVRNSIFYATLIVVLVVFPLFSLAGLEGRMFAPLGLAYLTTLLASLVVSLTVTPVLASYLLPRARFLRQEGDPLLLRILKRLDTLVLKFTLRHSLPVLAVVTVLVLLSVSSIVWMGGEFLPRFNEGQLTIAAMAPPGVSMEESNRIARRIEQMLMEIP